MKLPIIGQGVGRGGVVTARRAKNCYFEQRPTGEKAAYVARALPKLNVRVPLARGKMLTFLDDGYMYVDDEGVLKRFFPGAGAILPSTIATMANVTEWVGVANGHDGTVVVGTDPSTSSYSYITTTGSLTPVVISGETFTTVVYHRGWYLYGSGTGKLWWSDVSNTVDGLNFAAAEASRDRIVKLIDIGPAVAVFGERTIEFWASTGNADAVFSPIPEATQKIGIGNPNHVKKIGKAVYFWGFPEHGTPGLYLLDGMQYKRLSTEDIERELGAGIVDDWFYIHVDGFELRGHVFVHVSHRFEAETAMLDVSTGVWTIIGAGDPYSGVCHFASGYGIVYVASATGLGEIDPKAVDEVDRLIVTDHITDENFERITMGSVRVDCGGMSQIRLRVSRDGGISWGSQMTANVINSSVQQIRFNRLGTARQFTFEISATGGFDIENVMTGVVN